MNKLKLFTILKRIIFYDPEKPFKYLLKLDKSNIKYYN